MCSQHRASLEEFEELSKSAKDYGIRLNLGEAPRLSLEILSMSSQYLRDMIKLSSKQTESSRHDPEHNIVGPDRDGSSRKADQDEEEDDQQDEEDEYDEVSEDDGQHKADEVNRLKRKGFTYNPICHHCKVQYDPDDNPPKCCRSHTGTCGKIANWPERDL